MSSTFHLNARMAKQAVDTAWQEFCRLFPTTQSCVQYLYEVIQGEGSIECSNCASREYTHDDGERFIRCNQCKHLTWFTSKTLFDHAKNPRAWLGTIWLMEKGLHISANALAAVIGVAPSTALNMLKKTKLVISRNIGEEGVELPLRYFENLICKRSGETPAREHPSAELDEMDKHTIAQRDKKRTDIAQADEDDENNDPSPNELHVLTFLSQEPVWFDRLHVLTGLNLAQFSAALGMLEVSGLAKPIPGNRYVRINTKPEWCGSHLPTINDQLKERIEQVVRDLKETLHGCSAKAHQLYLADNWRTTTRTVWRDNALLRACLRAGKITDKQIFAYVTPPMVQFVP